MYLPNDIVIKSKKIFDKPFFKYKTLIDNLEKKYYLNLKTFKKRKGFSYIIYIEKIKIISPKNIYRTKNTALYFAIYDAINYIIFNKIMKEYYFIEKNPYTIKKYLVLYENSYFIVKTPSIKKIKKESIEKIFEEKDKAKKYFIKNFNEKYLIPILKKID